MSVVVRFAPSPTGYLHVGNARALISNFLFARQNSGTFILRMDDTDAVRCDARYEESICDVLKWLGITYDRFEHQSQRFERYRVVMHELIEKGFLYLCYETPEELEFKRKIQLARKSPPVYDRSSLLLTKDQCESYEREGRRPHWRFKLDQSRVVSFNDLIKGDVSCPMSSLSDPVLVREDGAFLYTLPSVIDDIDFLVTHVLRGEDHLTNTAVQIQLFEAITQKPCPIKFAHMGLLLDVDGGALSKRLGSLGLHELRERGLEPMTLMSYLARLGTSLPVVPSVSLVTLIENFDITQLSRSAARFCESDLWALNHKVLQLMTFEDVEALSPPFLEGMDREKAALLWPVCSSNLNVLSDFVSWYNCVYADDFLLEFSLSNEDRRVIDTFLEHFPEEWSLPSLISYLTNVSSLLSIKGRSLLMPLRLCLTGVSKGPDLKEMMLLMGRDRVYGRFLACLVVLDS